MTQDLTNEEYRLSVIRPMIANKLAAIHKVDEVLKSQAVNSMAVMALNDALPLYNDVLAGYVASPSDIPLETRLRVAKDVLDRVFGKPKETIDVHETVSIMIDC